MADGQLQRFTFGDKSVFATTEQQARNVAGVGTDVPVATSSASTDKPSKNTVVQGTPANTAAPAAAPQTGTLNAVISSPNKGKTVPAPIVVDSSMASKDLAAKKTAADQLAADTAAHQALVKTPPATTQATTPTQPTAPQGPLSYEDEIGSLLGGLQDSQDQIQKDAGDAVAPMEEERQQAQASFDQAAASALKQLSDIASGTYPLSPAEQNLLTSTTASYTSVIDAQNTANNAYTGQMTEAMASLGINTSAPTEALGMIHLAISTGNEKVADINSQMSQALATLTLGFQKQDYTMVSDAWDKQSTYLEDRIKTIADMEKQVTDAAHQQQQDIKDFTALTISTIQHSQDFTETQKQNAIQNALASGRLSEEHRHNLVTEGINGAGGGNFSPTQINTGAANAGVPLETFKGWDADTKNLFISGDVKGTKSTIDDALKSASVDDVVQSIKDMKLPGQAESYFIDYAKSQDTGGTTADKHAGAFADTFTDLKSQGYDRGEALDEVLNEWGGGDPTSITKADTRTINDALGKIYGLQTFGIPDVQLNSGEGFTRYTAAK